MLFISLNLNPGSTLICLTKVIIQNKTTFITWKEYFLRKREWRCLQKKQVRTLFKPKLQKQEIFLAPEVWYKLLSMTSLILGIARKRFSKIRQKIKRAIRWIHLIKWVNFKLQVPLINHQFHQMMDQTQVRMDFSHKKTWEDFMASLSNNSISNSIKLISLMPKHP